MKLLTSQKDTLFESVESSGLSPSQFEFQETPSLLSSGKMATRLIFKNSEYYFSFETHPNSLTAHYAICCPGNIAHTEHHNSGLWHVQLNFVNQWLNNLIREINSPNKWDRLNKEIEGIGFNFENSEDKFTVSEYEDLKQRILILQTGISSIGLLPEQVSAINAKLDHLTDLAKVMNKFDWKGLLVGTIITIVIQLNVNSQNAQALWTLIKQIFNNYLLP